MKPRYFMSSLLLLFRRDNASLVAFMLTSLLDYVVAGQVKEVPGTHQSMTVHAADLFYLFLHLFFCYIENLFDRRISCICQSLILYDFFSLVCNLWQGTWPWCLLTTTMTVHAFFAMVALGCRISCARFASRYHDLHEFASNYLALVKMLCWSTLLRSLLPVPL